MASICLSLLIACDNPKESNVRFLNPQPENMDNESHFPRKWQGRYLKVFGEPDSDSSDVLHVLPDSVATLLYISDRQLTETTTRFFRAHRSQWHTPSSTLESIRAQLQAQGYDGIAQKGDTIVARLPQTDTIFTISDTQVVRHYRGRYFLNYKDQAGWETALLTLKKDLLQLDMFYIDEADSVNITQLLDMETLPDSSSHTHRHVLAPSRRELRKTWNDITETQAMYIRFPDTQNRAQRSGTKVVLK